MHVIFTGPDAGVRLSPAAGDIWCPRGEPVEVPDEVGAALCDQPTFERAPRRRRPTPAMPPEATGETPESPDHTMETRHGTST